MAQNSSARRSQARRTFKKKQQEEHKLGLILVGMSALFIFCQSFKIVPDMHEMIVCNRLRTMGQNCGFSKSLTITVIVYISHFLVCLNSSANFLIYYLNGEKFRKAWVEVYGGCLFWKKRSQIITTAAAIVYTDPQPNLLLRPSLGFDSSNSNRHETFGL